MAVGSATAYFSIFPVCLSAGIRHSYLPADTGYFGFSEPTIYKAPDKNDFYPAEKNFFRDSAWKPGLAIEQRAAYSWQMLKDPDHPDGRQAHYRQPSITCNLRLRLQKC
jgi:hypothetical protein